MKSLGFVVLSAVCGAACGFHSSPSQDTSTDASAAGPGSGDAGMIDSGAMKVPADAQQCFGTGLLKNLCLDHAPTGSVTLQNPINTDDNGGTCTKTITGTGGPDLCVIAADTITVTGNVTPTGNRALVLIAADTITIPSGTSIDVSSRTSPAHKGAAASPTAAAAGLCLLPGAVVNSDGGAGGGAGGSFSTLGANGGEGDQNRDGNPKGPNTGRTAATAPGTPTILRGGCAGSAGGDGNASQNTAGPAGGEGGGALYLIAANKITVTGDLFASGAGGATRPGFNPPFGPGSEEGGGGGGAGGMIGLDAAALQIDGRMVANGGGGGGGGNSTRGGAAGDDGTTTTFSAQANGGAGANTGGSVAGNGGKGSDATTAAAVGSDADNGAGGGGGGVGYLMTWGVVAGGAQVSPGLSKN